MQQAQTVSTAGAARNGTKLPTPPRTTQLRVMLLASRIQYPAQMPEVT
jgi:hypothetical protein